jgi:hypothetical protein
MSYTAAAKTKRLRGTILQLLCTNHDAQASRFDATALWSALVRGLNFDASRNEVKTVIQDLCGRGYCTCKERKNLETGEVFLSQIELTPKGRDLLEGTIEDPAVEL